VGRLWLGFAAAFLVKVLSEMPSRIFRFEDYEDQTPGSPLMETALDVVELMGKSGLTAIPRDPTEDMVTAAMDASGVTEEQARAVFRAMIAVCDDDGLELKDFAN
jgi:hypothetical protein